MNLAEKEAQNKYSSFDGIRARALVEARYFLQASYLRLLILQIKCYLLHHKLYSYSRLSDIARMFVLFYDALTILHQYFSI